MARRILIIVTFYTIVFVSDIFSCSCGGWHSFTSLMKSKDVIVVAEVNKYSSSADFGNGWIQPLSMEIIIDSLVAGSTASDTLVVWGDNGMLCAPYVDMFPVGSKWLFALNYIDESFKSFYENTEIGDYFIGGCGDVYLEVIDTNAVGYIFEEDSIQSVPKQTFSLSSLIEIIQGTETNVSETNNAADNFTLSQNYPNPFNPATTIEYTIPAETQYIASLQHVSLKVFDVLGREVATLVDKQQKSGVYKVLFDGDNLSSGMYYYKLTAGNYSTIKKMLLIK